MDAIIRTYARNIVNFDNREHIINCYFIKVAEILGFLLQTAYFSDK